MGGVVEIDFGFLCSTAAVTRNARSQPGHNGHNEKDKCPQHAATMRSLECARQSVYMSARNRLILKGFDGTNAGVSLLSRAAKHP